MTELDLKLKNFKIQPQTKEQAQESIRKLKAEIGMSNIRADKDLVRDIITRAGSLADEVLESRERARKKRMQ